MAEPERSLALPAHSARAARAHAPSEWESWSDEQLLDLRLCDLGLRIRDSELGPRIKQLYRELRAAGVQHFRPHFWLSDEWYTPDGVPGVAIPFYMAHPRLSRLEFAQMLEVEGGTPEWCMRILRHEAGHALDNAYRLRRRHRRQQLFGLSSKPYPEYYTPRPYSRSYVQHLEPWYAQSHPDEDFAETFAVWLTPDSPWRARYQDWPALKKLEFVDALMREIGTQTPRVANRLLKRIRATPLPTATYLGAVLCSTLLVFVLQMLVTIALGLLLYDAKGPENTLGLIPTALVGVAAFAGMGFGAAAMIRSAEGASAVVNLIVLPMAFLSGSFGPTRSYPEVLQWIADLLPLTYLIRLLKDVYLRGDSFFGHPQDLAVLAVWGLAGLLVAWRRFGWEPREQ